MAYEEKKDNKKEKEGVQPSLADRVAAARMRATAEDVLYCWALAEAYNSDFVLKRQMRLALKRHPQWGMLGEAKHGSVLATPVELLPGLQGLYKIGACQYRLPPNDPPAAAPWEHQHTDFGFGSEGPRFSQLQPGQGESPTRIDWDGAAETFGNNACEGYLSRRMEMLRVLGPESLRGVRDLPFDEEPEDDSEGAQPLFPGVPVSLNRFRTPHAVAVFTRHIRVLFGSRQGETQSSLRAWLSMCEEARHWGRSIFDAESIIWENIISPNGIMNDVVDIEEQ